MPISDPIKSREYQREYRRQYQRQWDADSRQRKRVRRNERRDELREKVNEYKLEQGCVDCGYAEHAIALDFDHLGDKEHSISRMVAEGYSWDAILVEIEKCEVTCANCHRVRTQRRHETT